MIYQVNTGGRSLSGFEYMFDASSLIINSLRHHCHHISGLRAHEYRNHYAHKKHAEGYLLSNSFMTTLLSFLTCCASLEDLVFFRNNYRLLKGTSNKDDLKDVEFFDFLQQ